MLINIDFNKFVKDKSVYEIQIVDDGTMLVLTLLLMFDQMHDFGENSTRNNINKGDINDAMSGLKKSVLDFVKNKDYFGCTHNTG